jgi:hypothetical protein
MAIALSPKAGSEWLGMVRIRYKWRSLFFTRKRSGGAESVRAIADSAARAESDYLSLLCDAEPVRAIAPYAARNP